MGNLRFRLQTMFTALMLVFAITASAQNIRYVKTATDGGKNTNDGTSWAKAKDNIQDAINDLVNNNLTGEVWVAAGDYYPTESTESSGSQYYKAFKIPAGITVRGGFKADLGEGSDGKNTTTERPLQSDKNFGKAGAQSGNLDGEGAKSGVYQYKTVLHGDLSSAKQATKTWNPTKNQFDFTFYGNSYHVVWFAMNGFNASGRANPLAKPAKLEGCVVEGGHAYTRDAIASHPHEGYGGGIYMVANSFVYNCEVRNCDASRNGGGIYMDGGGIVRRTYVHDCQALGSGTEFGLGGGICEDGTATNSKTNPIVTAQSVVTNCVGRMGGGMALLADQTVSAAKYSVVANSTLVNNNTAHIEAGGVYTYKGGGISSLTIVRNKCVGTGVTQNEVITGRSGGLYSRDAAYVGNTVMWGNECSANNNVQYANSRSSLADTEKSKFYYNAISNADNTDWSGAVKMGILSLNNENDHPGAKTSKGFPLFFKPTATAGYLAGIDDNDLTKDDNEATKTTKMAQWTNWQISSESFLTHAGIATVDLDNEGLTPAPTGKSWDMQFGEFNSRPSIGALISQVADIAPAQNITYEGVRYDYAFFVDPDFIYAGDNEQDNGVSWDLPSRFLGNVLDFIENPRSSNTFNSAPDFTNKKIAIFVKQGTIDNTRTGGHSRVRVTTLDIPSNVSLFGSFNGQLVGQDLSLQNVVHTPTVISGKLMNNYDFNVAHLINIKDKHDIHIHGFKLSYANATSTALTNDNTDGAAITLINSKDIKFHNIIVSNCKANHGAAVYADNSTVEFENCIFHNNTSHEQNNSGIVYGINGSVLDFNHCDVLRNVGHASYLGGTTSNYWQNSIFYGNLNSAETDTNVDGGNADPSNPGLNSKVLVAFSGNTDNVSGHHCMFDAKSASFASKFGGNDTGNQWQYNLQYAFVDGTGQGYPRFINPTKNSGVTEDGDQTYYGRAVSFEPHNNNPIVNMASHADIHTSWGRDLVDVTRDFGGLPDIGAVENHVANQFEEGENAYADGQKPYGEAYFVRDYSDNGSGLNAYMTVDGSTKGGQPNPKGIYNAAGELLDGSSWEYAVNGNGMYDFGGTAAQTYNTVFKTIVTTTPGSFKGTFTIKNGNYYIYLDGSTPKLTNNEANATHFEVEGVTTSTMSTGKKYIKGNNLYLYASSSGASTSTSNKNKIEIGGDATNGFTFKANNRYYRVNNGSLTVSSYSGYASKWTFTPDMNQSVTTAVEKAYKQDGTTEVTTKTTDVTNNAEVTDHLKFHVYKSLDDYKNSTTKKTYKIKRQASAHYLKNTDNYLYSDATKTNGDNFILLQDGAYGKYYLYDVTTQKYLYYFTGTSGTSHVRAGYEADKTTWWINEPEAGVLNFVFGAQPKGTDGNYAITVTAEGNVAATVDAQGTDNAKFVLVANANYDVYNYEEGGSDPETINGLQYAVNTANAKYAVDQKPRQVSVAKGIYTNKTAANTNSVSQPYAYMMKEGVNVYGGFPENGNPGMNERQPKEFETVLQPQTGNPFIKMTFVYGNNSDNHPTVGNHPTTNHIDMFEVTNWGANANANNAYDQASVGRVLVQPTDFAVETLWDGFTLRHGYLNTAYRQNINQTLTGTGGLNPDGVKVAGGAGVLLLGNGALVNSVVKDNLIIYVPRNNSNTTFFGDGIGSNSLYTNHIGGAGVFMTGSASKAKVENCEIGTNQLITKAQHSSSTNFDHIWQYGAGLYQNGGNVYNTIIHDNTAAVVRGSSISGMAAGGNNSNEMILGAGAFIANGNFYNNTIVANTSATFFHAHNNHVSFSGVHVFDNARIYNSIIADNIGHWAYEDFDNWGGTNPGSGAPVSAFEDGVITRDSRQPTKVNVKYSYVDVKKREVWSASGYGPVAKDMTYANDPNNTNIYLNYGQGEAYHADPQPANIYTTDKVYHKAGAVGTTDENRYHIFVNSPCFNAGTEAILDAEGRDVVIPDYDAEYTDRIKDCRIDIGAYEFNAAANVAPQTTGTGVSSNQAIFYVTHNGFGSMTAEDPANAACAAKLQIVLDAAGRYKYLNPTKQVIVKVANDWDMLHPTSGEPEDFTYYATRTTDQTDQDVRVWSIMVPRGVEVWGGYTDVPMKKEGDKVVKDDGKTWSNTYNGFYSDTDDLRDITGNPTYFDSYYENKLEHTGANTYHVVTFTDRIFDQNGLAYTKDDFKGKSAADIKAILKDGKPSTYVELPGNNEDLFAHMSDAITDVSTGISGNVFSLGGGKYASNRAVIDGIFVSGGQADASSNSNNSTVNINSYGGAALVNDFAYVRNCVLTGNTAINGGALALTDHALVSGCLILDNEAHNNGGGIYVFEEGTKLSNGTTIESLQKDGDPSMDYRMAHVLTSTIVNNSAEQGGGVWYTTDYNTNVRFNSVAIWQNQAADQANVYGTINPEQPTDDETISEQFYPFSYSLIQNMRASGTNNLSAMQFNSQGVRFVNKTSDFKQNTVNLHNMAVEDNTEGADKYANFGFYGLTTYSMLCSNGMPESMYEQLKQSVAIADDDIMGKKRITPGSYSKFIEIGARALTKEMPEDQLMLRLFVAHPEDVNTEVATSFMTMNATTEAERYYAQEGSSFAYPFNFLQDALDYIKMARNGEIHDDIDAKNLPFEILVGKGEWYPKQNLNGETKNVWSATFAIPEGVTIMGGFDPQGGSNTYYGRYYEPKATISTAEGSIYDNVKPIPAESTKITEPSSNEIGRGYEFDEEPVNGKTFQRWNIQDIADRRGMADINKNGIIEPWEFTNQTIISGNAVNGETDGVYHVMTAVADANAVGLMPKTQESDNSWTETGYKVKEVGQQIRLNGLVVTGGNALTYLSTALDDYGSYIFYQGAGLQVDGNRYNATLGGTPVFHNSAAYGVGYRDIPVSVTNCQFRNNKAGYGGAISTNGSLSLFASSFEQNIALAQTETPKKQNTWKDINGAYINEVNYPGQGGAILATLQLSAFNTLFANNEARHNDNTHTASIDLFSHKSFRVPNGAAGTLRAAGGAIMMGSAANHHIVNCDFVRNKANAYPAVFTMNPTVEQNTAADAVVDTHDYSQIINTVAWGNEVSENSPAKSHFAANLMVNVGKKTRGAYSPVFSEAPASQEALDNSSNNWMEANWFCAYEDGVGFKPNNTNDLRDLIVYSPKKYAPTMIMAANNGVYQNCNILIDSNNGDVAGPNFGNPSVKAGYDGFTESADWSPSRFNRLTDNGNGWIKQTVKAQGNDVVVTFHNDDKVDEKIVPGTNFQGAYPITHYISDIAGQFPEYKLWLSLGNEKYMGTTNNPVSGLTINGISIGDVQKNLPRISPDPTMGVEKAYIDIGVYEYVKQPLIKPGSEVDILWVSTKEKPENGPANGATWKTPTSDLQGAIEALLSSRNGHKKEIRIMEGEYAPVTPHTVNGAKYNAFVIDTKSLNARAIVPSSYETDTEHPDNYYAQSLTIKGGYSSEVEFDYDPVKYKTVIRQPESKDGSNSDHLIYVADPTLRYYHAGNDYKAENKFGALYTLTGDHESNTAKTMPIQLDGVTLINDKAASAAQGSAIYYPDMTGIISAHSVSTGGTIKYYTDAAHTQLSANDGTTETNYPAIEGGSEPIDNPAKILIAKTQVIGSGKPNVTNTGSAVYIGEMGGSALIYNTVFHSNYGMPLDAYNTVNINNTFAKNAGLVQLQNATGVEVESAMHNSVMWENNGGSDQFSITDVTLNAGKTGVNAKFTYNSFTGGDTSLTGEETTNSHNTGLIAINNDLGNGPNFVDPTNADIEARNYDIKPSVRLLNKGQDTQLTAAVSPAENGVYYTTIVAPKYDYSLVTNFDKDVLFRNRLNPSRIDIGAYEFQGDLNNILYVDPNISHRDEATGENWDKAFGYGDLQDAMDLAAIAHMSEPTRESYVFVKGASSTNKDLTTNETLTIRDGVTTYGSIPSNYIDWHDIKTSGDTKKFDDIDKYIEAMKSDREGVASNAANKTVVTGIKTAENTSFNGGTTGQTPAVVDGYVVTNKETVTTPVVDVTNKSKDAVIVLRNILVTGNNTSSANVAKVTNGLIYEVLMHNNTTTSDATLKIGNAYYKADGTPVASTSADGYNYTTYGYAVNVTVEGVTKGADNSQPVDGGANYAAEKSAQIFNSITNSIGSGSGYAAGAAAPYGKITNKGISGYFYNIADANLNYQLTETSKYIDMCETTNPLSGITEAANLVQFINYTTDRDLLGNPRLLTGVTDAGKIDRGAFETWKVLNTLNGFTCGDNGTIASSAYSSIYGTGHDLIKKHFYPHDGSVVYVMENQSLVIDAFDPAHEVKPTPHNPGFMLVKNGANFYGNGRPATCAFLAVERNIRKGGSIVAVPYAMKYETKADVAQVSTETNGDLKLNTSYSNRAYKYSGNERMDWKYIFQTTQTNCWDETSEAKASQGVLFEPNGQYFSNSDPDNTEKLFRFTGKGTSLTDYIYTEELDADKHIYSKSVTLYKYDDSQSTNHGADYTDEKDMGWNCIGLPWLVSNYKTYEASTEAAHGVAGKKMMNIPHEMWLYYDGVTDGRDNSNSDPAVNGDNVPVNGNGGYYSVNSWESSNDLNSSNPWHVAAVEQQSIWVGEGIFVQTATLNDTEELKFYRPVAPAVFTKSSTSAKRYYFAGVYETNTPEAPAADDAVLVATEFYTADGVHLNTTGTDLKSLPQMPKGTIILMRQHYSNGKTKTQKFTY